MFRVTFWQGLGRTVGVLVAVLVPTAERHRCYCSVKNSVKETERGWERAGELEQPSRHESLAWLEDLRFRQDFRERLCTPFKSLAST